MTEEQKIQNRLISDLSNLITELENGTLDEEILYGYFSDILLDAKVDSKIVVNVLEYIRFGELGKNEATNIKMKEGW